MRFTENGSEVDREDVTSTPAPQSLSNAAAAQRTRNCIGECDATIAPQCNAVLGPPRAHSEARRA